jgi:hypothetical protein
LKSLSSTPDVFLAQLNNFEGFSNH